MEFLLPLTNNKWPLGIDPGGHNFVVLNVSINKKPFFVSEVVTFENAKIKPQSQLTMVWYLISFIFQTHHVILVQIIDCVECIQSKFLGNFIEGVWSLQCFK